jgi:predicted GTPase
MISWRWWVLGSLVAAPFLFLIVFGGYQLWATGWFFWAWWPLTASLALAIFLAWRWQKNRKLFGVEFKAPTHWTERDKQALQLLESRAKNPDSVTVDKLTSLDFYVDTAKNLALELAQFYHPKAKDPIGNLTILEILAVVELAAHDLGVMVEQYLPGSHFLTINGWRKAQKAVDWYQKASNVGWIISGLFNPIATGARYVGTQLGLNRPWQKFQENLQIWFYTAFINRLGSYLIELYSGRLQRGAMRHRELFGKTVSADGTPEQAPDRPVHLVILGQTKAGKSSLINALLGERKAETDVIEATSEITRYELKPQNVNASLVLSDTVGYANEGPRQDQLRVTEKAAREADVLLLVLHARNPARQADVDLLKNLAIFFQANPDLKRPPILAVVSHIDLLSPGMEWSPPYDWTKPQRPKERSIAQALAYAQETLGEHVVGVVPVCTTPGKEFGIEEALTPSIITLLDQARAVSLVRCLRAEADSGKVKKTFQQLLAIGTEILSAWWEDKKSKATEGSGERRSESEAAPRG